MDMKYTTTGRCIRPTTAGQRSRRVTIVGLAALSFVIATVDTAEATSEFVRDNTRTAETSQV